MKRKYLLAVLIAAAMPLTSMAQDDDLYFNPKKEAKEKAERRALLQRQYAEQRARRDSIYRLNWSGSDRSVDEYNRGGRIFSHYENVRKDSLGNDIIQFHVGKGVAPDSIYDDAYFAQKYADRDEDFVRTREMSRWDGFYDPWFYDYYGYGPYYWRSRMWGWHNPWRYGYYAGWYDPWFDPWYDPWYYGYCGWYGGWYAPWYYGWGGYYNPWYWGGPVYGHVSYGGSRGFNSNGTNFGPSYSNNGMGAPSRGNYRVNGNRVSYGNMTRRNVDNRNFSNFQPRNNGNNNSFHNSSSSFGGSHFGSFGGGSVGGARSSGGFGGGFGRRR